VCQGSSCNHSKVVCTLGWCWLPCKRSVLLLVKWKWNMLICIHTSWSWLIIHPVHLCMSTYTYASYRIANRDPVRRARGARGTARGAAARSNRGGRGGRWRPSGVPRSPPKLFRTRQAPKHFFLSFANYLQILYLKWCIKFRSCLKPLLHYTLYTLVKPYPCYPSVRSQVNA
jgi:hypothetical protein